MSSQAMPQKNQNTIAESLIGAAVVVVAAAFLTFSYYRTGGGSLAGYEVNAKVAKADGLAVGTDVRLAGIKVGTVSDLTLDPQTYLVTVHMNIRNDVKLPVDSSVLVTQAGFLGGQYLSITPGGEDKMMASGAFFENAQGSIDVVGLVSRFTGGGTSTPTPAKPAEPQVQPPATQSPAEMQGAVKAPDP